MKRWLALAVVAAMLAVPVASSQGWTQAGYDASRTGDVPQEGPSAPDVAFELDLPGALDLDGTSLNIPLHHASGPLIHDGSAYLLAQGIETEQGESNGVIRVDLATGEAEPFVLLETQRNGIALDGDRLFVSTWERLEAYNLSTGERVWEWEPQGFLDDDPDSGWCAQPAVKDGTVYHACKWIYYPDEGVRSETHNVRFVVAADAETGETGDGGWVWTSPLQEEVENVQSPRGLTVTDSHLFTTHLVFQGSLCRVDVGVASSCITNPKMMVNIYDVEEGALESELEVQVTQAPIKIGGEEEAHPGEEQGVTERFMGMTFQPTGTDGRLYVRIQDEVLAFNPFQEPEDPEDALWSEQVFEKDVHANETFGGFALAGNSLYTTSAETLYRFDVENPQDQWRFTLPPGNGERFAPSDLVLSNGTLYALAQWRGGDGSTLYAVDAETREVLWRHEIPAREAFETEWFDAGPVHMLSMGEGVITVAGRDGSFYAIGTTPASPEANAEIPTEYPATGEQVTVDLSGTKPGVFGDATRYRADWGDGTTTSWQTDPVLTHTYNETGDAQARFWAGNANQSASTTQTFHVGKSEPTEPNAVEKAFQKDNQDMTFGVIGVALALGGGVIGVARRKRRKSLLEDELEALEAGFEDLRDRPSECEAFLDNRKARARSLALDDKLDEQQVSIIENRAEELRGDLRVSMLDERFAFLPHGMVQTLERMLEDGRINAWERETFLDALDDQEMLTEEQKGKVERLIGQWLDEGGRAA